MSLIEALKYSVSGEFHKVRDEFQYFSQDINKADTRLSQIESRLDSTGQVSALMKQEAKDTPVQFLQ